MPLEQYLLPMALCADAEVRDGALVGDPTEGALVVLAAKGGVDPTLTREQYPRVATLPFDAAYKMMATFHAMKDAAAARTSSGPTSRARRTSSSPARRAPTGRTARRSRSRSCATPTSPRTNASARWACGSWPPARRTSIRPRSTRTRDLLTAIDGLTLLAIVGHRRSAAAGRQGRHRDRPGGRHPGPDDHRRPRRHRRGDRPPARHRGPGHHRRRVPRDERRRGDPPDRRHRGHRPGLARGQGPPRRHPAQEGPRRRR